MTVLDLLFPKFCLGCGKKACYFCLECRIKIKKDYQVCRVGSSLDGLFSFFAYGGIIREAIHKLKYKLVTDLEPEFWQVIKDEIEKKEIRMTAFNLFVERQKPVVVPIPLYWRKQNFRGFNQSSLFGKRIADHFKLCFLDKILVRGRNSISQTKLTQKERRENVKGIFSANSIVHGSLFNVLLIDDVWTTGSTMKEAARVLKEAGVKKVWGLTIAR